MKPAFALAAALLASTATSSAFAQEREATEEPPAATPADPAIAPTAAVAAPAAAPVDAGTLGAQFEILPTGTLHVKGGSDNLQNDTDTAYAISGTVGYDVTPSLTLGAAPRFIFNLQGKGGTKTANEIDLRARATLHTDLSPGVKLYGFFAPGYSVVVLPDNSSDNPAGLVLGFGAGVMVDFNPTAFATAELGYQLGFQGVNVGGVDYDITFDLMHVGLGVGTRF